MVSIYPMLEYFRVAKFSQICLKNMRFNFRGFYFLRLFIPQYRITSDIQSQALYTYDLILWLNKATPKDKKYSRNLYPSIDGLAPVITLSFR